MPPLPPGEGWAPSMDGVSGPCREHGGLRGEAATGPNPLADGNPPTSDLKKLPESSKIAESTDTPGLDQLLDSASADK